MDRRAFLGMMAGATSTLAGCAGGHGVGAPAAGEETETERETPKPSVLQTASPPTGTPAGSGTPLARRGTPPNVCDLPHIERGITPVVEPAFGADWSSVAARDQEPYGSLDDEVAVIVVENDGRSRAYPVPVLWYHEIVNDRLDRPLLVTYCPVCRSGVVAERAVAGETTRFGVTGRRWRPPRQRIRNSAAKGRTFAVAERDASEEVTIRELRNLVMYDVATDSYWSQVLARAICGTRRGERLSIVPSTTTTYGEWRQATDGNGEVLLPPPHSGIGNP